MGDSERQGNSGPPSQAGGVQADARPVRRLSLEQFRDLIEAQSDAEWAEAWASRALAFGNVWWLPDAESGIGGNGSHPWVVIVEYRAPEPLVLCALRTTKRQGAHALFTPAGIVPGLDQDGWIVLAVRQAVPLGCFRRSGRHGGILPAAACTALRAELERREARDP